MDDIVTYLIVTCDVETSVSPAESMTHQKGLQATVLFLLEVRGVNFIRSTLKTAKLRCEKYCAGYRSTPYAQPDTCVFGT